MVTINEMLNDLCITTTCGDGTEEKRLNLVL